MAQTKRLDYLDNMKAFLIMLVVLGHAIQFTDSNHLSNFAFRVIYSFHMPLFFFISGYLANRGRWNSGVIGKRAYQLLLPFVTWAFLAPLMQTGSVDISLCMQTLIYPDRGLWFLYNLFIYSAMFNIAEYVEERYKVKHIITTGAFIIVLYALMTVFHTKFNCSQLAYHALFYGIGYYWKLYDIRRIICKYLFVNMLIWGGIWLPFRFGQHKALHYSMITSI